MKIKPEYLLWGGGGLLLLSALSRTSTANGSSGSRPLAPGSGTIRYPGGTYTVTQNDLLWLKRALVGEVMREDDGPRVVEVLLNRYAYLRSRGNKTYPTFASFVRAYAQPVNPIWMSPFGKGCLRSPRRCTPALLAKRAAHATRNTFPAWVDTSIARALARGPVDIPRNATHYAGYNIPSSMKQLTPHKRGYNTLWTQEGSQSRWEGYAV